MTKIKGEDNLCETCDFYVYDSELTSYVCGKTYIKMPEMRLCSNFHTSLDLNKIFPDLTPINQPLDTHLHVDGSVNSSSKEKLINTPQNHSTDYSTDYSTDHLDLFRLSFCKYLLSCGYCEKYKEQCHRYNKPLNKHKP